MNAFFVYRKAVHKNIAATCGTAKNNEISIIAGKCWSNEPAAVRDHFRCLAEKMAGEKNDEETAMATALGLEREQQLQRARSHSISSFESPSSRSVCPAASDASVSPTAAGHVLKLVPQPNSFSSPVQLQAAPAPRPPPLNKTTETTTATATRLSALKAVQHARAHDHPYPSYTRPQKHVGFQSEPDLWPFTSAYHQPYVIAHALIGDAMSTRSKQIEFAPQCGVELEAALQSWMAMIKPI